jgi:hypothetical protein
MYPCPPPCGPPGNPLPITTGRIGISQYDGSLTFYGHNYRGTGMGLFHGWWSNCPPAQYPMWRPPSFGCKPWAGGCSCGCNPCCCDNTKCFTYLLTHGAPWCCYWKDQQYAAWLTGKDPWPATAAAAAAAFPSWCMPPAPPAPAPTQQAA